MMPFAFGNPGTAELVILAFVAFLIFGNRLPKAMESLGRFLGGGGPRPL
jgi:Sec-independent protein translocase protein TatA